MQFNQRFRSLINSEFATLPPANALGVVMHYLCQFGLRHAHFGADESQFRTGHARFTAYARRGEKRVFPPSVAESR